MGWNFAALLIIGKTLQKFRRLPISALAKWDCAISIPNSNNFSGSL
ncbi:MAG: hypothetical protein RL326_1014 [Pseudomonadota bacterium]|jgi:hypothetical protein